MVSKGNRPILLLMLLALLGFAMAFSPVVLKRRAAFTTAASSGGTAPDGVSGLILWLAGDAIVGLSDMDPVANWEDQSSENNDAKQTIGARKPTYLTGQIDSKPAVSFDGGDYFIGDSITDWSGASAAEIFLVLKMDADPAAALFDGVILNFTEGIADTYTQYTTNDTGKFWSGWGRENVVDTGDPSQDTTQWHLLDIATAANDYKVRINGVQHFSTATCTVTWGAEWQLGGATAGAQGMKGKLAEVISYSRVLSGTERTNLQIWLDAKYPSLGL